MDGRYLIPANSKNGKLIFNVFRPFDIILGFIGLAISMLLLVVVPMDGNLFLLGLGLLPGGLTTILVLPIPNYHNVLIFFSEMFTYLQNPKIYMWKGWCIRNGQYRQEDAYNRSMVTNQRNK